MSIEARGLIHILSAGAAKAVVEKLAARFTATHSVDIAPVFGAVGAMREILDEGAPCDVIILTTAQINALAIAGRVMSPTMRPMGAVFTGLAVRATDRKLTATNPDELRAALLAADGIFFPDPQKATAGIHFAKVLDQLGIADRVASRLITHPSGAVAMRAMAESTLPTVVGCTQVTEILYTSGISFVSRLPKLFELATSYSVAVCESSATKQFAVDFATLIGGAGSAALRRSAGFESVA